MFLSVHEFEYIFNEPISQWKLVEQASKHLGIFFRRLGYSVIFPTLVTRFCGVFKLAAAAMLTLKVVAA